jgi:hypothetical protein
MRQAFCQRTSVVKFWGLPRGRLSYKTLYLPFETKPMPGRFLLLALSLAFCSAQAQFVAQPGTVMKTLANTNIVINSAGNTFLGDNSFDLSQANVVLALTNGGIVTHAQTVGGRSFLQIDSLRMDGANGELRSTWIVTKGITLKKGKLEVKNAAPDYGKLVYSGTNDLATGNDDSYIIGPMFMLGGGNSHTRTYPIGNVLGFYPAQLSGLSDATALFRMQCFAANSNNPAPLQISDLAQFEDIDDLLSDRFYQFNVFNNNSFAGAPIALSLNNTSPTIDISKNKAVIVEIDSLNSIKDLQGAVSNSFVKSSSNTTSKGGKYMIAASKDVAIKIHKLITPNSDGENDALVIEGIDLFPVNKVTLLDRWGGVYFTKSGFASGQTDIDYTKLVNGNYICIVEYTDSKGTHKPKPQMITVLK